MNLGDWIVLPLAVSVLVTIGFSAFLRAGKANQR